MQVAIVSCFSFFYQCIGSRCEISTTCIREIEVNFYLHDSCKFSTNITLNFYLNLLKVNQSKFENLFEKKILKKKNMCVVSFRLISCLSSVLRGRGSLTFSILVFAFYPHLCNFGCYGFPYPFLSFLKKASFQMRFAKNIQQKTTIHRIEIYIIKEQRCRLRETLCKLTSKSRKQ